MKKKMKAKCHPVEMDGSRGEGGGQVLRTSLSLAAVLGNRLRVTNVRAGRRKSGLLRQHLTCVKAIAAITNADVRGAELGSTEVEVRPQGVAAGNYHFSVGSAGSTLLVLQTVLPVLLFADDVSSVTIEGGTHNPFAPPFEVISHSFLPLLRSIGVKCTAELVRPGYMPVGGGEIRVTIEPWTERKPLELLERGEFVSRRAEILMSHLEPRIAQREVKQVVRTLGWQGREVRVVERSSSRSAGNVCLAFLEHENVTEVFSALGSRGVRGKEVVRTLAADLERYLATDAPVGEHLADQLLLPLALGAGGEFRAASPTLHTTTNAEVIGSFLPNQVELDEADGVTTVSVRGRD